jgi:hypothetical protein
MWMRGEALLNCGGMGPARLDKVPTAEFPSSSV